MDDFLDRISTLSPKRLALLALELHDRLEAGKRRSREPIAIIGMGCRFPGGADDPESYWALLREGRDAIIEVPPERWDIDAYYDPDPDAPARISVREGGFLRNVGGFDAAFFGIAPREALTMDPQQRLLLEVAWEALEHAGLAPERLAGSATGVFVGVCNSDHFQRMLQRGDEAIDAYVASGSAPSVAAGRISYFLDLQGPAVSIDTACSSSLVALHLACQSLRQGESQIAVAAGVNVICSPEMSIALSKAHMLAPDGRCKTFDARADGFSRGEGCGVLVLKRLADSQADGDRVLAVIRGSAINQDGRSGGLTVPNGPAQEAVIRAALSDAGLGPADIAYVEAHGTGTSLGDPIEMRALAGGYGQGRTRADPLTIGSVKTNIGHLESAAGVAGVIKVVLSLLHERIPPHLHFLNPSPHISWADYPVEVLPQGRAWPRGAKSRLGSVSSFGFSGTNAHVVIEEAPAAARRDAAVSRPLHCLPLSAKSGEALVRLAARWADAIAAAPAADLADIAHTAGSGRSHLAERLAVVCESKATAEAALRAFVAGRGHTALHRGQASAGQPPEVVFLFTGQGAQYPGMAKALYDSAPVFRDAIDRCDELLGADVAGNRLKTVLVADAGEDSPIHETAWTQPALFAVEYGLAQLWRSWGVEPAAVIGHSVGEYISACVAGVFTLEEGLSLIAERGRLMQALPAGGTMAAVFAELAEVEAAVAPLRDRVAIAAVNAADSVVISGDAGAVETLLADFECRQVRGHRLYISLAAHSPLVEPALDAMQAAAERVAMRAPRIPVAWNLSGGEALPGGAPDACYWRRHLREPVRFADGIAKLHRDGYRVFLEVGPHPTLLALAQRSLPEDDTLLLGSLRRGKDDWGELLASLAQMYVRGAAIDWVAFDRPYGAQTLVLPTYPFERREYWVAPMLHGSSPRRRPAPRGANALVPARVPVAPPVYETLLAPNAPAWLGEHRLQGAALVAGPVMLELAQAAAGQAHGERPRAVEGFAIGEPLVLGDAGRIVQVHLGEAMHGAVPFSVYSRASDAEAKTPWILHARGRLVEIAPASPPAAAEPIAAIAQRLGPVSDCAQHYERLDGLGIALGPAWRSLRHAHWRDGEALAWIVRPTAPPDAQVDGIGWAHPAQLDGALRAVSLAVPAAADPRVLYLMTEIDAIALHCPLPSGFWAHVRLRDARSVHPAEWRADVDLLAEDGKPIGTLRGVALRRVSRETLARAVGLAGGHEAGAGLYYRVEWVEAPVPAHAEASLLPPSDYLPILRQRFDALAREHGLAIYDALLPELDRLAALHIGEGLRRLGFEASPGRVFDAESEADRLRVAPRHARLFARVLAILAEDGVLAREGTLYRVAGALPGGDPVALHEDLVKRFGTIDGELSTLRRCGPELAQVLAGTQDPLQLLFPNGSFAEARQLYVESPFARSYNNTLAEALAAAIAILPENAPLRVLEIGAGTGGTTCYVLPKLPSGRTEYTFTDLSPLFLERAAEQFAAYPFVRRALLDIERDPADQGFEPGRYHVVIAANVLHATANLRQALEHARALLAPGGLLLLLEGMSPERWVDLTFGLTEGWWRFADSGLRSDYPLIQRTLWRALLGELGFDEVATLPEGQPLGRGAAQQALVIARAPRASAHWTLVGDDDGLAAALAARLVKRGDRVSRLASDAADAPLEGDAQLVYLGALGIPGGGDASALAACEALACALPLGWLARFARQPGRGNVWLVTRGAQAVVGPLSDAGRWQAPLWGLGRVYALEHPARWGSLVDLPEGAPADEQADALLAILDAGDGEDQCAWRDGHRLAARLRSVPAPAPDAVAIRPDATYLVTGGFGGLGLLVGHWLAERGARHIALLGRRPDPQNVGVRRIEALGARVWPLAGDVAEESQMDAALRTISAEGAPPLAGIVHAAADLGTGLIAETDTRTADAQIARMLRPKLAGTLVLERIARDGNLDFLALFSSTTALLGASGFAHYAAANAFLDATAQAALGRPGPRVLSVNWGTWESMRLASAESQRSFRDAGLEPMPADEALDALARLLADNAPQVTVARIDWARLKSLHELRRMRPMLKDLGQEPAAEVASESKAAPELALLDRLALARGESERQDLLLELVHSEVAAVLGLDGAHRVPPEAGLFELGMDSLMSVELKRRLERGIGRKLPSTLTFNYPNVSALGGFLLRELQASGAPVASLAPVPSQTPLPAAEEADYSVLSDEELEARLLARLDATR